MTWRRLLAGGVFTALAAVALAQAVELRLWNIPNKNSSSPPDIARRRVFDAFVRANPEIKVRALVPLQIQGPAAEGSEFLAVAGGVAPDVFSLYGRKLGDYRDQRFLLPINPYLESYRQTHGQAYAGISAPDTVWRPAINRDKVYAVPMHYYSMALRLRKASFARAGMVGQVPRNWDELYQFARKLTFDPTKEPGARSSDPIQFGLSMQTDINAGWTFHQYVWSAGGEILQPFLRRNDQLVQVPDPVIDFKSLNLRISNAPSYAERVRQEREELARRELPADYGVADLEWQLVTDRPEAMKALYFYRKLVHQPWMRVDGNEFDLTPEMMRARRARDPVSGKEFDLNDPAIAKRIYNGVTNAGFVVAGPSGIQRSVVAMEIDVLAEANPNSPTDYDFAPFPSIDGSPPPAFIAGHYIGINAAIQRESEPGRSDIKAIQNAAWKYIQFVTDKEAQRIMIETYVEYGLEEMVRPSLLKEAGYEDALARIPANRRALWVGFDERAKAEPYAQGYSHVMTRELAMVLQPIFADKPDPKTGAFARDPVALMKGVVNHTNTAVLGRMPDSEVRRKSGIGTVLFVIILALLAFATRQIVRLMLKTDQGLGDEGFGVGSNHGQRRLIAWLFLIPAVATVLIWNYLPLARGLVMGFQDYRIIGESQWVGLRNFIEAVSEPKFWLYLLQTFQYMAMSIGIGFLVPFFLATLLHEVPRGKVVFRILYYLPAVTTGLVTLFLWRGLLYDPSDNGILNQVILAMNAIPAPLATLLKLMIGGGLAALVVYGLVGAIMGIGEHLTRQVGLAIGLVAAALLLAYASMFWRAGGAANLMNAFIGPFDIKTQSYLLDPGLAMLWVVVPTIWAGAGPGCLIYLAALKGVPSEQYEAADLDGAGVWEKLLTVTYPNLRALIAINFVGAVIGGFKESTNIFAMTGGGPEDRTMTVGLHIWYNAFMFLNFGLATAMAWIMGALLVGFTLKQLQILNKLTFRSTAVENETKGGTA